MRRPARLVEGRGRIQLANNEVYEGEFKANKSDGRGTYLYADGKVESCFYKGVDRLGESVGVG